MILWRALPLDPGAAPEAEGGALWFPRRLQGPGRHDNRERYGCLYAATTPVSAIAEQLAPFRGAGRLVDAMLVRGAGRLALAQLRMGDDARLLDLDDPAVLQRSELRPSHVATRQRAVTQAQALRFHDADPDLAGLRWWSTLEASWINVTLFDRAAPALEAEEAEPLTVADDRVGEAARLLGLA